MAKAKESLNEINSYCIIEAWNFFLDELVHVLTILHRTHVHHLSCLRRNAAHLIGINSSSSWLHHPWWVHSRLIVLRRHPRWHLAHLSLRRWHARHHIRVRHLLRALHGWHSLTARWHSHLRVHHLRVRPSSSRHLLPILNGLPFYRHPLHRHALTTRWHSSLCILHLLLLLRVRHFTCCLSIIFKIIMLNSSLT